MELDGYLVSDEPELGDNARRPPHLDGVGGKLRRTWLENVLHDGASVRPYMRTRMPVFGAENVAHLAALFEEVDATEEPLVFPKPSRETERESRDARATAPGDDAPGLRVVPRLQRQARPELPGSRPHHLPRAAARAVVP